MPTTRVLTKVAQSAAGKKQGRVTFVCPTAAVTLPNTYPTVEYLDLGTWQWKELPRTGQASLLRKSGVSRARVRLTATLRKIGTASTPEKQIEALRKIASQGHPVTVAYGEWIAARKWIINGTPTVSSKRLYEGTNRIMQAELTIELIQWIDEGVTKPAAATKATSTPKAAGGKKTATVRYVVKRGDTLTGIAKKVTGSAANFRKIAADNKIRNPSRLRVGQVLVIAT